MYIQYVQYVQYVQVSYSIITTKVARPEKQTCQLSFNLLLGTKDVFFVSGVGKAEKEGTRAHKA